jgi:ankyrin repeat protein
MPSDILLLIYRGDRDAAQELARGQDLTVFEAAALDALEWLIERLEADPGMLSAYSDDGWTPLHLAAFFGNGASVRELLRRGADVNARSTNELGVTPLHSACASDASAAARLLIASGADVNAKQASGHTPLDSALRNGNAELIGVLEAAGAKPSA